MENPITVSSQSIIQFGFKAVFDLLLKKIVISSADTLVVNTGTGISSLVYQLTDPTGYVYPELNANIATLAPVELPISSIFNFGLFSILATITDEQGKIFKIKINKEICEPEGWKRVGVVGEFSLDADCQVPYITVHERTPLLYGGKSPYDVAQVGKINFPDNTLNQLDFTFTPFTFGQATGIFTGTYRVNNVTSAYYDLQQGISIRIPYVTKQEFKVTCENSLQEVLCCINDQYEIVKNNPSNVKGTNAKNKLQEISVDLLLAIMNDRAGKTASAEIERIKAVLNCDCGCGDGSNFITPQLVGGPNQNIQILGLGGTVVTPTVSGNNTLYRVTSKEVSIQKRIEDIFFNITKTGSSTTSVFTLTFDHELLTQIVINTLSSNPNYIDQLNQILNGGGGADIGDLNGRCVIDLSKCSYSLVESSPLTKTISSIVIAGTNYPAPSNLSMRNVTALKSWLDSLDKGTFTATLNGSSSQLTILSSENENAVSTMSFLFNGGTVSKAFNKNCGSLSQILQAIIDSLCVGTKTGDVLLSAALGLCQRVNGEVVTTDFPVTATLQAFMAKVASILCAYAASPVKGDKGDAGVSVQVFVQTTAPTAPAGGALRNGDIWIVQ